MTTKCIKVFKQALQLSPVERAELVERILSSFEFSSRHEIDALWAEEAEERIEAYERGDLHSISAEKVFEKIEGSIIP